MEMMPAHPSKPTINENPLTWLALPAAVEKLAAASRLGMDKVTRTLVPVSVMVNRVRTLLEGRESQREEKKNRQCHLPDMETINMACIIVLGRKLCRRWGLEIWNPFFHEVR